MSNLLSAQGVSKTYRKGPEAIEVLKDLSLSVETSETIAIVGASGVGKSTLLHLLGALDRPTKGEVLFSGKGIFNRGGKALARFRNESIGFIFQFHYLLPEFTAVENVGMPLLMRGETKEAAAEKASALLARVGLEHRTTHKPAELSGGEQQRVAIARALIGNPSLVLADEPTGNLDIETGQTVTNLMFDMVRSSNRALVIATHNPELAMKAHRILRLRDGKLHEEPRK